MLKKYFIFFRDENKEKKSHSICTTNEIPKEFLIPTSVNNSKTEKYLNYLENGGCLTFEKFYFSASFDDDNSVERNEDHTKKGK